MKENNKLLVITVEEILFLAAYDGVKGQFKEDYIYSRWSKPKIFLRPCLRECMDFCLENFRVGLWSEYTEEMTADVFNRLYGAHWKDKFEFLLTREDCVSPSDDRYHVEGFIHRTRCKSLDVILNMGYTMDEVMIIDRLMKHWEPIWEIPDDCWLQVSSITKMFGTEILSK